MTNVNAPGSVDVDPKDPVDPKEAVDPVQKLTEQNPAPKGEKGLMDRVRIAALRAIARLPL